MNPSSLKSKRQSHNKLHANGRKEQRSVSRWTMDAESESTFGTLPDEVLLNIFRFLYVHELVIAEQVCLRWKAIVKLCFATKTTLDCLGYFKCCGEGLKALEFMRRYGPALKSLDLYNCDDEEHSVDWLSEIGNAFPKLTSIIINSMPIRSESLRALPIKCSQLTKIELAICDVTDADVAIVLKGLPGLKNLELCILELDRYEKCFLEMGTNIEFLSLTGIEITRAGTSHILSRCRNLQALKIDYSFNNCDAYDFFIFCKKSVLRSLCIDRLELSKEIYWSISRLSLLVKLELFECPEVDSDVLIAISLGCPNLTYVNLLCLYVCERGVKCFTKCKRLNDFHCRFLDTVTDESLFEIAKDCLLLNTLVLAANDITDRGVSAVLAQCPLLKFMEVKHCQGIGDSTVDAAIQAVESRHSLTIDKTLSKCTAIVPTNDAIKDSGYLLKLRMEGKQLNRYKSGFSHPLLCLDVD